VCVQNDCVCMCVCVCVCAWCVCVCVCVCVCGNLNLLCAKKNHTWNLLTSEINGMKSANHAHAQRLGQKSFSRRAINRAVRAYAGSCVVRLAKRSKGITPARSQAARVQLSQTATVHQPATQMATRRPNRQRGTA